MALAVGDILHHLFCNKIVESIISSKSGWTNNTRQFDLSYLRIRRDWNTCCCAGSSTLRWSAYFILHNMVVAISIGWYLVKSRETVLCYAAIKVFYDLWIKHGVLVVLVVVVKVSGRRDISRRHQNIKCLAFQSPFNCPWTPTFYISHFRGGVGA